MTIAAVVVSTAMQITTTSPQTAQLRRRLRPLVGASWLQAILLWVPIEKLFLGEIGFDAASIGLLAAAYAAVVPFLEIPSGILADRWSRRGVLVIAHAALAASALVGGIVSDVPTYLASAVLLGVFFAMRSGTVDALVYDTVLEETGSSDAFERTMGRMRAWESTALVISALAGGALAGVVSPRATYLVTIPFGIASALAMVWVREPRLHHAGERLPLRSQVVTTYKALLTNRCLRPVIATSVLAALLLQATFEFGPLTATRTVAMTAWAAITTITSWLTANTKVVATSSEATIASAAGRAMRPASMPPTPLAAMSPAQCGPKRYAGAARATSHSGPNSNVAWRSSTLTWAAFLPFALVFGAIAEGAGIDSAAWLLVGIAALTSATLVRAAIREHEHRSARTPVHTRPQTVLAPCAAPAAEPRPIAPVAA